MITFANLYSSSGTVSLFMWGDGVSTVLEINLSKDPISLPTFDNLPSVFTPTFDDGVTTGTIAIAHVTDVGDILTVTMDAALADGVQLGVNIGLRYSSLA